jgi:hypothetical protein
MGGTFVVRQLLVVSGQLSVEIGSIFHSVVVKREGGTGRSPDAVGISRDFCLGAGLDALSE